MKQNILVVLNECPLPISYGPNTHVVYYLKLLTQRFNLSVIGFYRSEEEMRHWSEFANEFETIRLVKLFPRKSTTNCIEKFVAIAKRELLSMRLYINKDFFSFISSIVDGEYSYVIYDRYYCFLSHKMISGSRTRKILIPHDSYSLACKRAVKVVNSFKSKIFWFVQKLAYQNLERRAKAEFDLIMPVSVIDADVFRHYSGKARIVDFGIPIPKIVYSISHSYHKNSKELNLLIHGSFDIQPICSSLIDFFSGVYERIIHQYPFLTITIWSKKFHSSVSDLSKYEGVKMLTWVEDYYSMLNSADIYLYPQTYGSGIQTKLRDAMALGLPCIARPETLEPLLVGEGDVAYSVSTDNEIVDALEDLIVNSDRRRAVGNNARNHIFRNFSDEILANRITTTIKNLV